MHRSGFAHSAGFLRVNKVVYNEARVFIYRENRFLFGYNFSKSGNYWDFAWKELGWSHVRRFLTDIGPKNVGLLQDVGIGFYDASPSGNPGMLRLSRVRPSYWVEARASLSPVIFLEAVSRLNFVVVAC